MDRDEIVAWVEAHRDTLPTTVAELSRFPIPFRVVIVNSVSPDVRTALWREHLETFLGGDTRFTAEQQQFVRETIDALPAMFGGTRDNFVVRAKEFEARMKLLFSRQQAYAMFGMVGPPEPEGGLPLPPGAHPAGA